MHSIKQTITKHKDIQLILLLNSKKQYFFF